MHINCSVYTYTTEELNIDAPLSKEEPRLVYQQVE